MFCIKKGKKKDKSLLSILFLLLPAFLCIFSCESTEVENQEGDKIEAVVIEPAKEEIKVFTVQGFFEKLSATLATGTPKDALALFEEVPEEIPHFCPESDHRIIINQEIVSKICDEIYLSKQPMIIAGGDIHTADADIELFEFVNK